MRLTCSTLLTDSWIIPPRHFPERVAAPRTPQSSPRICIFSDEPLQSPTRANGGNNAFQEYAGRITGNVEQMSCGHR